MKTNRLIVKILFLYLFIFSMLFLAFYFLMPFLFNNIFYLSSIFITTFIFFISLFLIHKNTNQKEISHKNCDIVYELCKNTSLVVLIINIAISTISIFIFRNTNIIMISLLSIFTYMVFYIFSRNYFKNILTYSENNLRPYTNSLSNKKSNNSTFFYFDLLFQFIILFISCLFIIFIIDKNVNTIIFIVGLIIITILSIINIILQIYINIKEINNSIINKNTIKCNNDFSDLALNINLTKQIYNNYINEQLEKERLSSIEIMRRTVDAKDTYTRGHSDRVAEYSVLIGEKLGLSQEELDILKVGGLFHDIGKIGIPDKILLKNCKLTDEEYEEIKKHPSIGAYILKNSDIFKDVVSIVLHHHERFDGSGYPSKLKGTDIPLMARIVSVADTFDAMTSKRSYRDSLKLDIVKKEFEKYSGIQFDPDITKVFLDILNNEYEKIEIIKNIFL